MTVTWSDGHVSVFKTHWLRAHDNSPSALHERNHGSAPTPLCAWDAIPKVRIQSIYLVFEHGHISGCHGYGGARFPSKSSLCNLWCI